MTFRDPVWWLAILLPLLAWWLSRRLGQASLWFSSVEGLQALARQSEPRRLWWPAILRAMALGLIVAALARPQQGLEESRVTAEGIDIVLVMDVSTSMLAEDFVLHGTRHNRLDVAKDVIEDFIHARLDDRIGLVVFGGRPYTACPLTLDHGWLLAQLDRIKIGMVEDGTAIGSALATGLNRLRRSEATSKAIILLTDGVNNAGTVTPEAAAQLAKTFDVKIYAIGAGTREAVPYPVIDPFGRKVYQRVRIDVDDAGLTRVAQTSGGRYFRATDTESLRRVYEEIDQMETTPFQQPRYLDYREWYPWFVIPALGCLVAAVALQQTRFRVLP